MIGCCTALNDKMSACESPVVDFLMNPSAYEVTPQRGRLQSYPSPQQLLPKSILSPLQAIPDPNEEEYRYVYYYSIHLLT